MTREEAIEQLKWYFEYDNGLSADKETVEAYSMAIKVLEQEPTTNNDLGVDCISREDVRSLVVKIDRKYMFGMSGKAFQDLYKGIDDLPSVTPQKPRWIPVREKLPNDRDWYLGIFKEPDTGWINPIPFICDYVGRETKATTKEHWILRGFTDRDYKECDYYFNLECVAWMPLPSSSSIDVLIMREVKE